jgi:hypothetical protein
MSHRFDPDARSWAPSKGFYRDNTIKTKKPKKPVVIDDTDFSKCYMTLRTPTRLVKKYGKSRKYCVEVTYDAEISEHGGYCSDSYDKTTRNEVITDTYPLLGCITNDDIDDDGYLVEKYAKMYHKYGEGCGSGYCGCGEEYSNFKVRVVLKKKPRKVTISNDDVGYSDEEGSDW